LAPGQRKRNNVTIRLRDGLKSAVQEAGSAEGRSLSEEIEYRLERSFLVEDHLAVIAGDPATAVFVREMLEVKRLIETEQGKSVWDDFECHEAMKAALNELLKQHAPKPSRRFEKKLADYERYKEKTLKPWFDRGGGGFGIGNPDAGPRPDLKPSPVENAHILGGAAVNVVRKYRANPLAEALRNYVAKED
jgi:hypothetical protein